MMSKIYADNLARSSSDSSRGIAGRGITMQATGRDLSKINCYYCNKFGHYKNDCAGFKTAHHQNRRHRQRHPKQKGGHQPDQPKPGRQQQQRGRGQMWCSYHKTTIHSDVDCRTRPANWPNGSAHFAQVLPPSVSRVCSSWDLSGRDDSNEKPCVWFLAREVQPATKPAKARVEEEKGTRPFGPVQTGATEGRRTHPWPFTPRAEPQPVTKPAKARVEEKGARPFGPASTTAKGGWRTRPWPFIPRTEQAISFGGPVAEETFGMADDEEPVEKALMASSSVAVTSKDSASSNLASLMAPAESLPGEVREPLSGGASTPLSGRASTPLSGGAPTPLSGGASTPSGVRASPEIARPSPAPVPATARTGAPIRNNRIHRPNIVTRRAAERFQSSTLHKLRQLGI